MCKKQANIINFTNEAKSKKVTHLSEKKLHQTKQIATSCSSLLGILMKISQLY